MNDDNSINMNGVPSDDADDPKFGIVEIIDGVAINGGTAAVGYAAYKIKEAFTHKPDDNNDTDSSGDQ